MVSRCCMFLLPLLLAVTHTGQAVQPDELQDTVTDVYHRLLEINNKRNMETESPFFAIRGKKSDGFKRFMKPNSLFGSIQGKRSLKPNSLFGTYGKRSLRPNSLFGIVTSKRSLKPNSLFGTYGKRVMKPNGLFGSYGKKSMHFKPNGLFAVGKKNSLKPNGLFTVGKKSLIKPNGLFSVGKKNSLKPNGLFYAGKKNMLKPNGLFSMSKKDFLPLHLINEYEEDEGEFDEEDLEEPVYMDLPDYIETLVDDEEMYNDEKSSVEKREDSDFWAARGKRDPADDSDFWATRGKRGHDGHDADFWAARGKRGDSIHEEAVDEAVVEAQEPKDV